VSRSHRVTQLHGSRVLALDGEIGKVRDVYFDDVSRGVRYLVVDTGGWLSGRKVLISPQAVKLIDQSRHAVSLSLNRERIEGSPNIDTDKPVSRQHESEIARYYGYTPYWVGATRWATGPMPPIAAPVAADLMELQEGRLADAPSGDTHLRSTREVSSYTVNAGFNRSDKPTRCSISLRRRSSTAKPTFAPSSVGS
jgi:PRC-barrel domain